MRAPIVADQAEFERWLVQETAVYARMVKEIDEGTSRQIGAGADMTKWLYDSLLTVLGRYTDRDPALLHQAACNSKELLNAIRTGPSLMAAAEARVPSTSTEADARMVRELAKERAARVSAAGYSYRCRGCSGTCCTGVGSDPCTCQPQDEDEEQDAG